jgi:hypothetical protein
LFSLAQAQGPWLGVIGPWQTALLAHASICAVGAILCSRYQRIGGILTQSLNLSALITSFLAIWLLVFSPATETPGMLAQRVFWLAGIWFVLLWLNRRQLLFTSFQIALTVALVLAIKATLQQVDWYGYLPHAFLHPTALQIQGAALVLLSLLWIVVRLLIKKRYLSDKLQFVDPATADTSLERDNEPNARKADSHWSAAAWQLLNARIAFDRLVSWTVLSGFVLLTIYGVLSGVRQELTARGSDAPTWNIVGFPHQYAFGGGSWILLGLLLVALLATLWERRRSIYLLGAITALVMLCPLLAGRFEAQIATASAWRWLAALFLLSSSLVLWFREPLQTQLRQYRWPALEFGAETLARHVRLLLLVTALTPLFLLTAYPALRAIFYLPVHGPSTGMFYALDGTISYSVPLVIASLVLIGYAARERLANYAFAAGLLFNLTATMVYLLAVAAVHGSMGRVVLAHTLQLNAITAAVYTLVWLATRDRWFANPSAAETLITTRLLRIQVYLAIGANLIVIVPVGLRLILEPGWAGSGTFAAGDFLAWAAFLVTAAAAICVGRVSRRQVHALSITVFLIGVSLLVAFRFARGNSTDWTGFHVLMIGLVVSAWLTCLARSLPALIEHGALGPISDLFERIGKPRFITSWARDSSLFATIVGALTVMLALRSAAGDPSSEWWSIGALLSMSVLAAALHWQTFHRAYLFGAQLLLSASLTIWWFARLQLWPDWPIEFVEAQVVVLSLPSILWLLLELRARRVAQSPNRAGVDPSFHDMASLASAVLLGGVVAVGLMRDATWVSAPPHSQSLGWLTVASALALMIACLWDQRAKYAVAGLYVLGLVAAGTALHQSQLQPRHLGWAAAVVFGIYTIAASLLWRRREKLIAWASELKIPQRLDPKATELPWLSVCNSILTAVVVILAYWIDVSFSQWTLRVMVALAVAAQSISFSLVSGGRFQAHWRRAAFAMFALGVVFFGWAWLVPGDSGTWLNRAVILMVAMFGLVTLFGLELDKAIARAPEWTRSLRACLPWLTGVGIVALMFVLATEVGQQINFGSVHIGPLALATTALTLAAAVVICILFALSPKHDPLSLSEARRKIYVYVAEVMLALLFMHIRLTMPWLFTGFFERYWPLVVVAIAYLGITASELLRRRKVLVLADPIERTGVLLPLLPVIGFWLTNSLVDYSVPLFIIGGLYGVLSILRKSFVFGVLAALASNGGLWYLLHRTGDYGFLQHPQLWLIPAAFSVLVAAYLNREDFSEQQMIGIRYLTLVTIYASSTADIFINGVARSPWLPLVLAALSVAGVLSGIMFRIRALLLLGSVFLLLAITTMIYYASFNFGWTWLWYVAGIVTGAIIIFTFALFEKKRDEMLRVVEGLKEWQR